MPQPSLASQLRVIVLLHELPNVTSPRLLTVVPPHPSDAVGAVNVGLAVQLIVVLLPCPPMLGGVRSTVQLTVRDIADVLLQASVAVNVLVCERLHPVVVTVPSIEVTVEAPHPSVAVAVPSAASI